MWDFQLTTKINLSVRSESSWKLLITPIGREIFSKLLVYLVFKLIVKFRHDSFEFG